MQRAQAQAVSAAVKQEKRLRFPDRMLGLPLPAAEPSLRSGLEAAYRELASHARTREDRVQLVDRANSVRAWSMQ